ncbi:CPBP family intramembrane metalloprotease [Kovacikia minuta CCNUW1]|uniref:CPBP family intramembrane glutamic endopeptidase n=1 Tax=Kovacikia minuta TaxID=2931930 RepID=UPI001CCCDB7E|nr:CPBP family intramembrane metalloprotease [Kovacikia minuta CCNUW1]
MNEQARAGYILINYILLAAGGLAVLFWSIRQYFPLPEGWFRLSLKGNWFWWGLGGYFAALPLVIVVSLVNQAIWKGQGGSNPILPIALEGKDNIALAIFFLTASLAAPLFEETLFRGFLLPSLTRYLPIWGAIILSALIFAIAHLSLSEVLPLTTLGIVLGFVYARSRNLLASMLLHSLWNSGTLISLILLGSVK